MTGFGLRQNVWVLVCDGRKALLLQNSGDRTFPKLETRETFEQKNPSTHEQGTDRPGRVLNSTGSRHGAVEAVDYHDQAERSFLNDLAHMLARHVEEKKIEDLIIVAPARALGMIRQDLSPNVKHVVRSEIDKDFLRMPVYEIEKHLAKILDS